MMEGWAILLGLGIFLWIISYEPDTSWINDDRDEEDGDFL